MTLTGANADHRLRVPASLVPAVAARLALEILKSGGPGRVPAELQALAEPATVHEKWIVECAKDLLAKENAGKTVVLAGHRQPLAVHALAPRDQLGSRKCRPCDRSPRGAGLREGPLLTSRRL